jgi:hypothetical protein
MNIRLLVGKYAERKQLAKPTYRWEGGMKIDLGDTRYESVEWIKLTQERVQ